MLKTLVSACVSAVLAMMGTTAHAQTIDNRTFFTFSQPVTLPGVTLPAGKYLFRIPDTTTSRRVVQVLSADGMRSYAMLLSIPAQRGEAPARPEIRFMETAENMPAAIKTWWYPGNTIGYEFIYPKEQALRLAKTSTSSVLTTTNAQNDSTEEMKSAELARVGASGTETAVTVDANPAATTVAGTAQQGDVASSTLEIAPTPTPVDQMASANPVSQPANAATSTGVRTRLPQTASQIPGLMLLGLTMLVTGITLSGWPRPRV